MKNVNTLNTKIAPLTSATHLNLPATEPIVSNVLKTLAVKMHADLGGTSAHFSPPQSSAAASAEQRVLSVLEQRPSVNQPNLADQILYLMHASSSPLEDAGMAQAVAHLLDQPSHQDVRKTYAQLISDSLQGAATVAYDAAHVLSRNRRALAPDRAQPTSTETNSSPRTIVTQGDSELALLSANAMLERYIAIEEKRALPAPETVSNIPPFSTFGLAWSKLSALLTGEPFKTFAASKGIDVTTVRISLPSGTLNCLSNGKPAVFTLTDRSGWYAVAPRVLTAAKQLTPLKVATIDFPGVNRASLELISRFYHAGFDESSSSPRFFINFLNEYRTFHSLLPGRVPDSFNYRKQAEAIRAVGAMTPEEITALTASRPSDVSQQLKRGDSALARLCSQALINNVDGLNSDPYKIFYLMIHDIPEDSTFSKAQEHFRHTLNTEPFARFAVDQSINLNSISIDPISGDLHCTINGDEKVFKSNDASGWKLASPQVLEAVRTLAAGLDRHWSYPQPKRACLFDVMAFYGESPVVGSTLATFNQCARINRNNTFSALVDGVADPRGDYRRARERQQSVLKSLTPEPQPPAAQNIDEQRLVEAYATELLKTADGSDAAWVRAPEGSTLGKWLEMYRGLLDHPLVADWMREQKIDPALIELTPSTGELLVRDDSSVRVFSLNDDSDWKEIAPVLLSVANVIAPVPDQSLRIAPGNGFIATPLEVVANFYGEQAPTTAADIRTRVNQLRHKGSFDPPAPNDALRPARARTAEALDNLHRQAHVYSSAIKRSRRDKTDYKNLMTTVARDLPNLRAEAKKWAEALVLKLTGKTVDADTIYLNRFQGSQSANTVTGWEHMNEEPTSSLRLPDALLHNFSEDDWVPGNLDSEAGLYTDGPGKSKNGGYGTHNELALSPSQLMHESWKTDFQNQISQKLDNFWTEHADDYRAAVKGQFIFKAREQLKAAEQATPAERAALPAEQRFTRQDYELVMKAAANVPLDVHQQLSLEQIRTLSPVKHVVRVHAFDINGLMSNDILRFTELDDGQYRYLKGRRDGRQILYIPGNNPDFLRFDSLESMDNWIADQAKNPDKRKALASHFTLSDRQERASSPVLKTMLEQFLPLYGLLAPKDRSKEGIDSLLDRLSTGSADNLEGNHIDQGNFVIHEDVFSTVTKATSQRMRADADTTIKSNSEVTRDTWLNDLSVAAELLAKLAPIAAPVAAAAVVTSLAEAVIGAEKSDTGDTEAERSDGSSKMLDGVLNALFSCNAAEVPEDPFVRPTSRPLARPAAREATGVLVNNGVSREIITEAHLPVQRERFSDGTTALVLERPMPPDAYTVARSDGFDLVAGEKVYRYESSEPDRLTDLATTARPGSLDRFEEFCPAPMSFSGRMRRDTSSLCFVKSLADLTEDKAKELQSLEHTRLYPAARKSLFNSKRFVVAERRLNEVVETEVGSKLVPVQGKPFIEYKSIVTGTITKDARFGMVDRTESEFLRDHTYVVKLGNISSVCKDSRELRGIVVTSPVAGDTAQYLVIEADTAQFYTAKITPGQTGEVRFIKCDLNDFNTELGKKYRAELYARQGSAALPIDADFVALPPLDKALADLKKSGYTDPQINELKTELAKMSSSQKREVVYELQARGAIEKQVIALKTAKVRPLTKPRNFNTLSVSQKNEFFATRAKEAVTQQFKATGLGPGNLVRSADDVARARAAHQTLQWMRRTHPSGAPERATMALKSGVGNCGEMSLLAKDTINSSGGRAYEWRAGNEHAFTVVGGPAELPGATVDFSGPEWGDAWIVDPWADIACPASQYTGKLDEVMRQWEAQGIKIVDGSGATGLGSPTKQEWLDALIEKPKTAYPHSYELPAPALRVPRPDAPVKPPTVYVPAGASETLEGGNAVLSTRGLSDCSALIVLTDLRNGVFQKRTLMHLLGSNVENGLGSLSASRELAKLEQSLGSDAKVIFVGGSNSKSVVGMATVLGQTVDGRQPLLDIVKKPGVSSSLASATAIDVNPDGTFQLVTEDGTQGVLSKQMAEDVFGFID
ncbi:dermonecrotic toxin domain-containing protein [Pseudomonas sp. LG1E9]|uniref:dermonecrotic toxin domain-containing protein n=1 Tax=Pseudomonas sp. LG1E9 TaxID=2219057 RepID=UPI000DD2D101|nr:DUF6543 domain-containing protein [Pseudomonas sp. LG1E9]